MEPLVALLRGEAVSRDATDWPATDWDAALDLAQEQHVLPFVAALLLDTRRGSLPEEVALRLEIARRDATLAAFFWTSELRSLLAAFAAQGVEVIALKGPSLAERVYSATALRISQDLDLLVRKADYAAAETLLAGVGFVPVGHTDDYHRQWRRASCTVELHFDIENPLAINFDIDGAWRQSISGSFAGAPCRLLCPADELLFLCIHGVRHRFERLSLVLDIALALERFEAAWPRLRPALTDLERLLRLGVAMARHLRPTLRMDLQSTLGANDRIQPLADRLWLELTSQPAKPLDWSSQHKFFLETELTPTRRLARQAAHLRIVATRMIDPDYAFARRFGLTRTWQVWLLRPFRLILARSGGLAGQR